MTFAEQWAMTKPKDYACVGDFLDLIKALDPGCDVITKDGTSLAILFSDGSIYDMEVNEL